MYLYFYGHNSFYHRSRFEAVAAVSRDGTTCWRVSLILTLYYDVIGFDIELHGAGRLSIVNPRAE